MKIKKCPFCGADAIAATDDYEIEGTSFSSVTCIDEDNCEAQILVSYDSDPWELSDNQIISNKTIALDGAIKRWNKRT